MPLNESGSNTTVQYTVTTTRVADGTTLYWKTTGNTTNSDIVGGNTGTITVTNNRAVFNVTVSADANTDGTKTLGISLSTGSSTGPVAGNTSSFIEILDTSQSPAPYSIDYLLVAGGGGGGISGGIYGMGGGGGAGGLVRGTIPISPGTVQSGTTLTLSVGAGGGSQGSGTNSSIAAPVYITTITAVGGGFGGKGSSSPYAGGSGGSGGGGSGNGLGTQPSENPSNPLVTQQYGNDGGNGLGPAYGAGGGGAGGAGSSVTTPSNIGKGGGPGYTWPVTGLTYALGGNTNPAPWSTQTAGASADAGTGSGGQPGTGNPSWSGGSGGSGTIILSVPTPQYPGSAPGATVTTPPAAPGKTVITFTSSGTYTA